eukprot:4681192-Prymnesium_polylepis.1
MDTEFSEVHRDDASALALAEVRLAKLMASLKVMQSELADLTSSSGDHTAVMQQRRWIEQMEMTEQLEAVEAEVDALLSRRDSLRTRLGLLIDEPNWGTEASLAGRWTEQSAAQSAAQPWGKVAQQMPADPLQRSRHGVATATPLRMASSREPKLPTSFSPNTPPVEKPLPPPRSSPTTLPQMARSDEACEAPPPAWPEASRSAEETTPWKTT